jgi:hypothetical protein
MFGIKIINGRAYHPQTQGSVERANQTFKRRLGSLQRDRGRRNNQWVSLLPELAIIINTTSSSVLPGKETPFFVWHGRKPHWIDPAYHMAQPPGLNDPSNNDDDLESDSEDLVLTEIETRVAEFNARQHARMIRQSQNKSRVVEFADGAIATLRIPPKLRLRTENERLAVRILAFDHGQYKLMSQHGRVSGRFPADDLNEVDGRLMETLGSSIPMEPEYKAGKEVVVPLSTAVARENNRGSITSAQRAGRATAGSGPGPANSLTRQRRQRPKPQKRRVVQERQPEPVKTRNLKAVQEQQPEPVRTQKRKAVEGIEEVDLGPRKLRSRK